MHCTLTQFNWTTRTHCTNTTYLLSLDTIQCTSTTLHMNNLLHLCTSICCSTNLLLIKLACESQLTEILFKLISGACQRQGFTIVLLHTYYYSSSGQNFGSLLLLHRLSQTHERGVKSCGLLGNSVLYLF